MVVFEIEGNADDLHAIEHNGKMESISLVKLNGGTEPDIEMTISSFNIGCEDFEHKLIKGLLGHKIRFTVETLD